MGQRVVKRSFLLVAVMSIMLFAMSITAFADGGVTGLKQTGVSASEVAISYNEVTNASGYLVYYAGSDGVWQRPYGRTEVSQLDSRSNSVTISGLKAATVYTVKVVPVFIVNGTYAADENQAGTLQVFTSPNAVTGLKQTKATAKTATLSWKKVSGANKYYIVNSSRTKIIAKTTKTSVTIKKLKTGSANIYYVYAVKKFNKKNAISQGKGLYVFTTPGKPTKLGDYKLGNYIWKPTESNQITIGWNRSKKDKYYSSGYRLEIYSLEGKKIKVYDIKNGHTLYKKFTGMKSIRNKGFKCRVTGYVKLNKKKFYGTKSDWKVIIPQPGFKMTRTGYHTVKLNWNSIKNATGYTVYACKDMKAEKPAFYKVKEVGAGTTSCEVSNLTRQRYVGFYVIPTVKVKGKTYKPAPTWTIYGYLN